MPDDPDQADAPPHRSYRLGHGTRSQPLAAGFAWPFGIDWDTNDPRRPLWLWEGVAHGSAAANVTPTEALAPTWREHFAICDAMWLLPLLERMAVGDAVGWEEVVRAHVAAHGVEPGPASTST